VLSWELDDSLELGFVLSTVAQAFVQAKPDILNSDQGSQFTSPSYLELLHSTGVRVSMDGKGRASDNIFTERLWRSLKYESLAAPRIPARLPVPQRSQNRHQPVSRLL
jgi:putative transposase